MRIICPTEGCRRTVATVEQRRGRRRLADPVGDIIVYRAKTRQVNDSIPGPARWLRLVVGIMDPSVATKGWCTRCRRPWALTHDDAGAALAARRASLQATGIARSTQHDVT